MRSFNALQSLRGLFAACILFHHLGLYEAGGDSRVCFFMILSGFVMSAGYWEKIITNQISYKKFMEKRFLRLYPLHLIGFLIAILLIPCYSTLLRPTVTITNLMMLQSWIPIQDYYFSFDAPSWCLSDMFFCYLFFPIVVLSLKKCSPELSFIIILLLYAAYFLSVSLMPSSLLMPLIYINPLFRTVDFILGIIMWQLYVCLNETTFVSTYNRLPTIIKSLIELTIVAVYVLFVLKSQSVAERYSLVSFWWVPTIIVIVYFAISDRRGGFVSQILSSRILTGFGQLSFSFYMLHVPMIKGYERFSSSFIPSYSDVHSPIAILFIFLATLSLSYLTFKFIEPRLSQYLKMFIERKRS